MTVTLATKETCCGCEACRNACPKSCITMRADVAGFLYPQIDANQCIDCGMCVQACPVLHPVQVADSIRSAYVVQHKDDEILAQSTSGGAFTAIVQPVIEEGGVVFGAAFDGDFHVYHTFAETLDRLAQFRGSKYAQSTIGNTFSEAKSFLAAGRMVCFSGTPCQIAGLNAFLQKDYGNLVTVDVICKGVPSPFIYNKYLELQTTELGDIEYLRIRDKTFGYSYPAVYIRAKKNGKSIEYRRGMESDVWLRTFMSGVCDRPCCKSCRFHREIHQSDFTIWDCNSIWEFAPELDNDRGVSRMTIQTGKGVNHIEKFKSAVNLVEISPDEITDKKKKKKFETGNVGGSDSSKFYSDAHEMDAVGFFNKYFPDKFSRSMLCFLRTTACKMKIHHALKRHWDRMRLR